jgi:hypothetical protein
MFEEPGAGKSRAGVCAGGRQVTGVPTVKWVVQSTRAGKFRGILKAATMATVIFLQMCVRIYYVING